jgi:hypothetical protein
VISCVVDAAVMMIVVVGGQWPVPKSVLLHASLNTNRSAAVMALLTPTRANSEHSAACKWLLLT